MSVDPQHLSSRRSLKTRDKAWAHALAMWLARKGISPNLISVLSVVFAAGAMLLFLKAGDQVGGVRIVGVWVGALACMQARLLCNLMDGMVAVEGGKGSPEGAVYNDLPDRVADVLIFVGAGYSAPGEPGIVKLFHLIPLGWCCAVASVWTAYVRVLGASLTGRHDFSGPMAKQHRMAVLSAGVLIEMSEQWLGRGDRYGILAALTVIFVGALWTSWRRSRVLIAEMKRKRES